MANCKGCPGQTCGCALVSGAGTKVTGTGTAANPFQVSVDISTLNVSTVIAVASSPTLELTKTGSGATNDPVVLIGDVVLRSPDNTRWTLAVSNSGALSAVRAGAARANSGGQVGGTAGGGTVLVGSDILYWDGTSWPARTAALHVLWMSLGFTGVPVPTGFKKGDTWIVEAS